MSRQLMDYSGIRAIMGSHTGQRSALMWSLESIVNEAWRSPRSALSTPYLLLVSLDRKRCFTCRQDVKTSSSRVVGVSSAPLRMYRFGRLIYGEISRNYCLKGLGRSLPYLGECEN
jgi:hypothetical protein